MVPASVSDREPSTSASFSCRMKRRLPALTTQLATSCASAITSSPTLFVIAGNFLQSLIRKAAQEIHDLTLGPEAPLRAVARPQKGTVATIFRFHECDVPIGGNL